MGHPSLHTTEQSRARDLQMILRTTLSLLEARVPHISQSRSLLSLDFALRSAIADLQQVDLHPHKPALTPQHESKGPKMH